MKPVRMHRLRFSRFRLCSCRGIPNISKITACMFKESLQPSAGCRAVMDRGDAEQKAQGSPRSNLQGNLQGLPLLKNACRRSDAGRFFRLLSADFMDAKPFLTLNGQPGLAFA